MAVLMIKKIYVYSVGFSNTIKLFLLFLLNLKVTLIFLPSRGGGGGDYSKNIYPI